MKAEIFILSICIITINSLHLDNHFKNAHVPKNHLSESVNYLHEAQTNKTDPQIVTKNFQLIDNQISLLQQTYTLVSNLQQIQAIGSQGTVIKCKNITKQDKNNIKLTLEHINIDLRENYFLLQQMMIEGQSVDDLLNQFKKLKQRKQKLDKVSINFCPYNQNKISEQLPSQDNSFYDVANQHFYSNLESNQNWVYGKLSQQQFEMNQFQKLMNNDLVQCASEEPFASAGKCIKCEQKQVFFMDTQKCGSCPNDTQFVVDTHICKIINLHNCTGNQIYNQKTKLCQCPSGLPNFDGSKCLGCYIPHYWNTNTKKCQSCSIGEFYSIKNESCIPCPKDQSLYISSLSSCHDQCTLVKPYFNGQACISCPQIFNPDTRKCQTCSTGMYYNKDKKICVRQVVQTNQNITCQKGFTFNSINGQCVKQQNCSCPLTYIYNKEKQKCICPQNLFDTGLRCVQCKTPNVWNQQLRQCKSCNKQQYFDKSLNKCVKCPRQNPVLLSNNTCGQCPSGQIFSQEKNQCIINEKFCPQTFEWNAQAKKCVCPKTKPIQTQKGCVSNCSQGQVWDFSSKKCINQSINPVPTPLIPIIPNTTIHKCKQGQIWSQQKYSCICTQQKPYKTSQGCIQCTYPMTFNQTQQKCIYIQNFTTKVTCKSNYLYDQKSNTCVCPKSQPFSDDQKCQSCYLPMYWSHSQKKCKYCPANQYFNPLKRICENCPEIRPLLVNYVCEACPSGSSFNKISNKCDIIKCLGSSIYSYQKNECSCPDPKKPFYNGRQCVSCPAPNRWDIASRSCVFGLFY